MIKHFLSLMILLPILNLGMAPQQILAGNITAADAEKITWRAIPTVAGAYGCALCLALADAARTEQWPTMCIRCLMYSSIVSCAGGLLCSLLTCSECRKNNGNDHDS